MRFTLSRTFSTDSSSSFSSTSSFPPIKEFRKMTEYEEEKYYLHYANAEPGRVKSYEESQRDSCLGTLSDASLISNRESYISYTPTSPDLPEETPILTPAHQLDGDDEDRPSSPWMCDPHRLDLTLIDDSSRYLRVSPSLALCRRLGFIRTKFHNKQGFIL